MHMARRWGQRVEVVLFENKHFGTHYNQCMGVLSPPIEEILVNRLGIRLPPSLVQRRISGYVLHTDRAAIRLLDSDGAPEGSLATRRVELDKFLNERVIEAGVPICRNRVTDMEFGVNGVQLYTEGGSYSGDMVVGAFGLDRQLGCALSRRIGYCLPDFLDTLVTKIHPGQEHIDSFGDDIHAFLPSARGVEFASLVPKGNHITALVAGRTVVSRTLRDFLDSPAVRAVMRFPFEVADMYRGSFPISPARNYYRDRFLAVGDSAGLVRPFKGKGINAALLSGHNAARLILERGVTAGALSGIEQYSAEVLGDLWYGRATRLITGLLTRFSAFDPVIEVAHRNPVLAQALYDSVSGHDTYRNIWRRLASSPGAMLGVAARAAARLLPGGNPRVNS